MLTSSHSTTMANKNADLAHAGYALAENIYCRGLYEVRKSDGTKYLVDAERETCNCQARVRFCKHLRWVLRCIKFAQKFYTTSELASSLYAPSRVPTLPAAPKQSFTVSERRELAAAGRAGADINQDF